MNIRRSLPLILLAGILSCPLATANHYKLFVLTGQSNSLGTTAGPETDKTSGVDPADAHIPFFWSNIAGAGQPIGDSGGVFTMLKDQQGGYYSGSATHWGPEIAFGRTLYRAGVRDFAIVKASRGGGGNSFWSKAAADHHMYIQVVNTVNTATADLTAHGHTFEIVGLLYLQGESDSAAEATIADTRLKELVDNLRTDLPNAAAMHGIIGGIAAAGTTRDTVRSKHAAIATTSPYIDFFSTLDQQGKLYDSLHYNKAAKITVGERYAQAFFAAGTVARHYGRLVFIGDSITQGGAGDHPSYRYSVFKHLANRGVPLNAATGYKFTGSVTGAHMNAVTTPAVNGQTFENVHDGHYGWRISWEIGRVPLPSSRRDQNRGEGSLLNWTGQSSPQQYSLNTLANKVAYPDPTATGTGNTGTTYTPDTVSIMIGINDLADGVAPTQVRDDLGTMIDQLRASNPAVRIHLNKVLHTNQGEPRITQVNTLNALLPALVAGKNAASSTSPVWLVDSGNGFNPAVQTFDQIHPNANGEAYIGDRIAAHLGLLETPEGTANTPAEPPHLESGSSSFPSKFEGNEIWNGTAFLNGWSKTGTVTTTLADTDLQTVNPGSGATWIEGTASGWNANNDKNWTFETRLKFTANPSGYILWLGTDTRTILVEIHGDRTLDNGANTFNVAHNNLDGQFHTFRVAHDSGNGVYHVWRDGVRLTPVAGAAYDNTSAESRMILGDYTSGTFGNAFNATLDYVRYDQTEAYLPTGADADGDGIPDSWEYLYYGAVNGAAATGDNDQDGLNNRDEYLANTDPHDAASSFKIDSIVADPGQPVRISLKTSAQRFYTLYKSDDLGLTTPWSAIQGPVIGTDGVLIFEDTFTGTRGFYRVAVGTP